MALPGIGRTTACAICAFAFNQAVVFIETNIRRVFIHHFFQKETGVRDTEILPLVEETLDTSNPRKWYFALIPCFTLGAMGLPHLGMRVYTASNLKSARWAMVWFTFFCGIVFCSTYTMGFSGVYFQAVVKQRFEVIFTRVK